MNELREYVRDLMKAGKAQKGDLLILGCSSSEVLGAKIGTSSSLEVAEDIVKTIHEVVRAEGVFLGVQCCEHLNRCIVIESDYLKKNPLLEVVNAIPKPKAGGSAATAAYKIFNQPTLVERIQAKLGIDIGDTEVGMHIQFVQIPFRHSLKYWGEARITGLFSRPKYIGGERTSYI